MNHPAQHPMPRIVAPADESWLDSLLKEDAAASARYIDDAGFTAAVMEKLPGTASPSLQRWIVPAMAVLGFALGIGLLSGGEILSLTVARLATFESFSLHKLLIAAVPLGIFYGFAVSTALRER